MDTTGAAYAIYGRAREAEATDAATVTITVMGTAPAGHAWRGVIEPGQALRIFTGAPIPQGADRVIIQEDTTRNGDTITLGNDLSPGPHIRPAGADFTIGDHMTAPRRLGPADLALAAAMNAPVVTVTRRPIVALIATGDELVPPGATPRDDQIIASNVYGLKAMIEQEGAIARILPIARDTETSLSYVFDMARDADLIVTIGGASVGDHDLVGPTAEKLGLKRAFYKVAMRPGKPLMAGKLGGAALLGLPGNPVSALVCGALFLRPMLRAFLGMPDVKPKICKACLTQDIAANGNRTHYMRAHVSPGNDIMHITPFPSQDSALLTVLAQANALLIRPAEHPAQNSGQIVNYIDL